MKRIKLEKEELQAFEELKSLECAIFTLSQALKATHDKAWNIIKQNHGEHIPGTETYGAYVDNKTNELVYPCMKDEKAGAN